MEQSYINKKKSLLEYMEVLAEQDVCLAFSGGVDSSLLLRLACDAADRRGTRVFAVTFQTRLHPPCDLETAKRVAEELRARHRVLTIDELELEELRMNPVNRCYLCKRNLFQKLADFAAGEGISVLLDGTNEDDLHVYRPGLAALRELGVKSPLAHCHLTKEEVKKLAAEYGISVAHRPSAPCMATRLPYGARMDYELLGRIAAGEEWLRGQLGGEANIRLRVHGDLLRLETDAERFPAVLNRKDEVISRLKALGFAYVTIDLEGFRSGSMDIGLAGVPEAEACSAGGEREK